MPRLLVKEFGPIRNTNGIWIESKKVTVFCGPQGSGKSTLVKLISEFSWLEKALNRGDFKDKEISTYDRFRKKYCSFHNIQNYFHKDTFIQYEGDNYSFRYENSKLNIQRKSDSNNYSRPQIIYIPAERNFVSVVPNLQKYAENDDNLMDFLLSWQEARKKYPTSHKLALLNLGMDFYSQDGVSNMVSLPQGGVVALEAASSGLQSIVPLLTLIDWLAKGIYQENKPYSYEEIEKIRHLLDEVGKDLSLSDNDSLKERLAGIVSGKIYTHTQFVIEEPEQNLFPTTQRDLVYYLLKAINHGRKHRLVVTTHSPYILHAFNNSMILGQVQTELPEEFKEKLDCKDAAILPEFVSVWQISDGSLIDIKDGRTNTIGKHYFNDVMNDILDDYYLMVPYLKIAKS